MQMKVLELEHIFSPFNLTLMTCERKAKAGQTASSARLMMASYRKPCLDVEITNQLAIAQNVKSKERKTALKPHRPRSIFLY